MLEAYLSRLRVGYLMAAGYDEDAAINAKELATFVYDFYLWRRRCEYTGNHYFADSEEY